MWYGLKHKKPKENHETCGNVCDLKMAKYDAEYPNFVATRRGIDMETKQCAYQARNEFNKHPNRPSEIFRR